MSGVIPSSHLVFNDDVESLSNKNTLLLAVGRLKVTGLDGAVRNGRLHASIATPCTFSRGVSFAQCSSLKPDDVPPHVQLPSSAALRGASVQCKVGQGALRYGVIYLGKVWLYSADARSSSTSSVSAATRRVENGGSRQPAAPSTRLRRVFVHLSRFAIPCTSQSAMLFLPSVLASR